MGERVEGVLEIEPGGVCGGAKGTQCGMIQFVELVIGQSP
jgi:hypothetical protein